MNEQRINNHDFETAGKIMTSKVPVVDMDSTIFEVREMLDKNIEEYEMVDYIYVLSKRRKLIGVLSVKDTFRSPKNIPVKKVMKKELFSVRSHTDQERATVIALEHNLKAVPVIDKEDNFLGVVTSHEILNTLYKEGIEDTLRSAGIRKFKDPAVELIRASTFVHSKKRFPWLLIGLFGGIIAAIIVKFFENMLDAYIILAAFIPAVVYMADAVGAQSQTIFIRSLALDKELKMKKYISREVKVNLILGSVLGIIFFLVVLIGWGSLENSYFFALILGISIFTTVLVSMAISLCLPVVFEKLNLDPAITSGPLATSMRDLTSLIVYFVIAHLLIIKFL